MERKQNNLVPIGEAFSGLDRPVKTIRESAHQALHHFTQADQVDELVGASEADHDLGFMARLMALCSLPRTNPGDRLQYKRQNGPYKLIMIAGGDNKLPFGNLPRLLLAWLCTEAVRTQSLELILGASLSEFMRKLGIYHNSAGRGGVQTRLRNQMKRLFNASVQLIYEDQQGTASVSSFVADRTELWWDPKRPDERTLWESKIELGVRFFQEIIPSPSAAGHEYPEGPQALFAGPGPVSMAHLPHLHAPVPAASLLEAVVPPVRVDPGQSGRQPHRPGFSH